MNQITSQRSDRQTTEQLIDAIGYMHNKADRITANIVRPKNDNGDKWTAAIVRIDSHRQEKHVTTIYVTGQTIQDMLAILGDKFALDSIASRTRYSHDRKLKSLEVTFHKDGWD